MLLEAGIYFTGSVRDGVRARSGEEVAATPVEDVAPGLENVTEAPTAGTARKGGGLEERSL